MKRMKRLCVPVLKAFVELFAKKVASPLIQTSMKLEMPDETKTS